MATKKKYEGDETKADSARSLRADAEEQLARSRKHSPAVKGQTPEELIHELRVHQIELEMQAEELRGTHLALEESRDKYLDLYEFAPLGYLTLTNEALITGVNLAGAALLRVERSRLEHARFRKFVAPRDLNAWDRYFVSVLRDDKKLTSTLTLTRGDGSQFPARLESIRLAGSSERTTTVRVAISDITDIRLAEGAQRESEERYRLTLDATNDGIWDWNLPTGMAFFSSRWYTMLGYEPGEMPGSYETWRSLIHPDDLGAAEQNIQDHIQRKEGYSIEIRMRTKQGGWCWILSRGKVIEQDADKNPVRMVGTHTDITDRKRAEEALRQANKQLHLLSSITRHDILNQLMALKGYIELSQKYLGDNKTLSDFVAQEEKAANTIEHQIRFTKDYQNLGVAAPAWQNVNESIRKAMSALPMRAVRVEPDPANPEVYADPLFDKVFYNLIDNALRYGGAQMKTIRISSQESDTSLAIVCEDDGVGITDEDKKRLFTRGFGKNSGLGLFLSREILSITGITITENGTPGKGTRFEITVPKGMWRLAGNGA